MDNKNELLAKISALKILTDDKEIRMICEILAGIVKETNKEIMGFRNEDSK